MSEVLQSSSNSHHLARISDACLLSLMVLCSVITFNKAYANRYSGTWNLSLGRCEERETSCHGE